MIKIIRKKLLASILSIAMLISFMPSMTLTVNAAEPEPYTATATVNDYLPLLVSELYGLGDFSDTFLYCVQGYTQPSAGSYFAELYYFDDSNHTISASPMNYLTNIDDTPNDTVESEDDKIYFKSNTAGEYTFYIRIYDYDTIDVRRKITVTVTDGDTTKPTLTAGAVNRTSDTEATVKFTSNEGGSYYYEVVEDGASHGIDTSGAGTPCTTDEVTITNPTGLTSGAKDIYIIVKDGSGNESTPLKIDIDAYPSGNSAMFDFESNTSPIADNSGGTALETVTQSVNGERISIASTGGKFIIGDETEILNEYTVFDGKVMAFDGNGSPYSTRICVSLQSGNSFNLNTFGVLDNYLLDHNPNPIMLVSSKGASYNVGSQISYGSDDNGVASIDVSSLSGFDNITYFDFYANGSPMQLALDNIYLTNITALPTLSSDATLKSSSTVKGQEVTSLGTPNATLGSESAGSVTITAAQAADTSNLGGFITSFDKNESNATMKVVKYSSGDSTTNFATDTAYNNEAITDGDFFIIKVTAQNTTTENFYKIIVTVTPAPSTAKAITAFNFNGLTPNVIGTVDEGAKTIALTVPYETNVTALVPSITHTGASVSPNTGVAQDFTNPVTYTVKAADNSEQQYTVTVTIAPNTAKAITAFNFNGLTPNVIGTVDEGAKTIALTVPYGTDVTALVPTITHTGASVSPNTGIAQNFTSSVPYTVTAADSTTQQYTVTVTVAANTAKAITAFDFNGLTPAVTGTVNEGAKTIALTVPYGTNVTALVPSITHTGASVSPNTGVAQDFTNPVTYTVTLADSTTQQYTVTVTIAPNTAKAITAFNFNGLTPNVIGTVDEGAKTIALTVPYGTNVTALVPTITHTGASVSPNTGVAQNFTSSVPYTVTAADSTTQQYTVTVTVAANQAKAITAFNFNGLTPAVSGTVNEGAKTIALTVPYGTDVTALVPTITHTGASISPNTGVPQNFTNPVTYTVTASDSSTQVYTVTVTIASNKAKAITGFNFNGLTPAVVGTVNEGAKTIALTVPYGTDVTALVPTITHTGASISPNTGVPQNFTNPVTYTVTASDSSTQEYTATVSVGASSNSTLSALSISSGTLSPAFASSTTSYTASVGNAYSSITVTPIVADGNATVKVNGLAVTSGGATGEINLSVGNNIITVVVTAQDGTTSNIYTITVTRAAASGGSSGGSSSTTTQPGQGTSQNTVVVVNGKEQNAGKETQATENGKSTVTVAVVSKAVESKIDDAIKYNTTGIGNVIQVPVADTKSEVANVELTGDIVKKLEENTFDVSVKRDNVEYVIPAAEFTISKVAENLGIQEKALADIKVEVKITKLDEKVVKKYNEVAKANGAELVFPPVEFEIVAKTIKTDGTTKEQSINKFSNYVERVMKIPAGVDPSKITTGIVFNADGTYSHVPTEVYQKEGKWYAKLNSLTNSNYSVIWNPVTVKSVENHWAKDAVNDMASRLVIYNPEEFEPNKAITRADFAEYIVRALGLYREGATHENNFKDVSDKGERTLAILIANEYGIVSGYSDGTFRGDNRITREEAMVMYQRAMGITKLVGSDENRYQSYTDYSQISDWAKTNVKNVLSAHVFNGTTATKISPKANLTYAEAAQAVRNLLIESKLISE